MLWDTLKAARHSLLEFSEQSGYRQAHCIVRLLSGKYTRTLGTPEHARHIRGNLWEQLPGEPSRDP